LELYGGEEEKLFSVMASQREKAGERMGQLSFPELNEADVKIWHNNWHTLHPETRAWHETCHGSQRHDTYIAVPTLDCRKRWFPGGVSQKNAVPNMQIQGFAASIANQALLKIAEAIPHRGWSRFSGLCLQVHDYIGCVVPESRAVEAAKIIEKCMFFSYQGVDFPAEAGISRDWAGQDDDAAMSWKKAA
jgi:DNA polymerase I-like protein with 3'-5' exonuclease and polymerase domains